MHRSHVMSKLLISDKIIRSAYASKIAYAENISKIKSIPQSVQLHGGRIQNASWIIQSPESGAHAYAWQTGRNSLLIAFKGSSQVRDFQAFLNDQATPFHFCDAQMKLHTGMAEMFFSLEHVLTQYLFSDECCSLSLQSLTFCGHSLGGSLATMAAAYYGNLTHKNVEVSCHTFGAPKVGDPVFVEWARRGVAEQLHFVNQRDLVPYLPMKKTYAPDKEHTILLPTSSLNIFACHDLDVYIENLQKNIELQKFYLSRRSNV